MIKLGVNVDHVATLRQARHGQVPSPRVAAECAARAGADGITVHLREDRRHIQEKDVLEIMRDIRLPLNLEMAAEQKIINFALRYHPPKACLVPERREELTTEGGLDVRKGARALAAAVKSLAEAGIEVSLFVDPDADQIKAARDTGARVVELHTGSYAHAFGGARQTEELEKLVRAAETAHGLGLVVNAGHGLNYENTPAVLTVPHLNELNIGHAIVAEALVTGMEAAVRRMKEIISFRESRRQVSY